MTALTYAATCLGDGHAPCDWSHDGAGSDRAAEKHTKDSGHATTTHVRAT